MHLRIVAVMALLVLVTGCDFIYGVSRRADLGKVELPIDCVIRATESVPGVTDVHKREENGGRELTLSGLQEPERLIYVMYKYKNLNGNYYFRTNYQGHVDFNHTYLEMNRRPPQEEIEAITPVMIEIEKAITAKCSGLQGIGDATQTCSGVRCAK